jgi:hypothetical protein
MVEQSFQEWLNLPNEEFHAWKNKFVEARSKSGDPYKKAIKALGGAIRDRERKRAQNVGLRKRTT